jgi:ubiquinone/menaquinone biosynthesis C-methylase UbiE
MNDKQIEIERYENRAKQIINQKKYRNKKSEYLYVPYKFYFSLLKKLKNKKKLLEIGAGMGENTSVLIKTKFSVCATDISSTSVEVMNKRFFKYKNFKSKVVDMEKLPFKNKIFDIICSAGNLSYGDNDIVMKELYRVLKIGGTVVLVDSLNDNPIYRLNRYIHYIKGNRSKNSLKRMPNVYLINKYIKKFGYGKVKFFGSITWAFPLLKIVLSEKLITKFSNWVDKKLKIKKSAFKFVLLLNKINDK